MLVHVLIIHRPFAIGVAICGHVSLVSMADLRETNNKAFCLVTPIFLKVPKPRITVRG